MNVVLPLLATLLGAVITYWINVRTRRATYVETLFNEAIAAVAAAEVSVDYLAAIAPPAWMTEEDNDKLQSWLVMAGVRNWATKLAEANEALARVVPYRPEVSAVLPFSPDATHRGLAKPVIEILRRGRARR